VTSEASPAGRRRLALRFGVLFPLLAGGLLLAATFLPWASAARERLADGVAATAGVLFPLVGYEVRRDGPRGRILRAADGHGVKVGTECDALAPMLILAAAVAVSPVAWRRKATFLVPGLVGIALLNQVRIGHLLWLSQENPDLFRRAHESWWPAGLVLAAAGLFLVWARRRATPA
jgi:exosortase/archaeosortase family protein